MIIYNFSLWLCKKLIHWHSGARFLQKPLCSTQCHRAKDFRLVLLSNQLIHYFIYFHHIKVVALPTAKPRISGGLSLYRQADFVSHFPLSISFQWHFWYCKVMVWKSPDKCQLTQIIFPNEACMPVYICLRIEYFAKMVFRDHTKVDLKDTEFTIDANSFVCTFTLCPSQLSNIINLLVN